ncbi:integrase catalytic domain-containing protein [Trichonephila clavipes]|nr:integrase catalytic domain-containing protein [Trichonephila clavipes]
MSNRCFNLRGWESNVKKESISKCEESTNVLGLTWNLDKDTVRCTVNDAILEKLTEMTKRTILSAFQGIFDPLRILTAATLIPKIWLQATCTLNLAWDSPLPLGFCNKFDKWFTEILQLQNIEIPRYCEMNSDSDLHVFVDASKNAYAACIFVRTKLASGIKLHLLRAKARVAPTKSVSMPRGAVQEFKNLDWIKIEWETEIQRIKWKFNPPTAALWGGWWERLIRVLIDLLKRTLRNSVLMYEEILTVLCDCESIVNSHPLTYVSEDSDVLVPLTPAMFMMSNSSLYVTDLHRSKVIELIPGRDEKVRNLKLRCSNSEIIRHIQRVFPFEIQSAELEESNDVPLDAEALKIPSASVDVSESAMIPVGAPPNIPKNALNELGLQAVLGISQAKTHREFCRTLNVGVAGLYITSVSLLLWPARSPDLSPIKHERDIIGRKRQRHFQPELSNLILTDQEQQEKSPEVKASVPKRRNPAIIVKKVPNEVNNEDLLKVITEQNPEIVVDDESIRQCRVRFTLKTFQHTRHVVIETHPTVRKSILRQTRLKIIWSACDVDDFFIINRCFNCLGYNHRAD